MDKDDLALLLGMLCGDGCLIEAIRKNKKHKFYSTSFYNSKLDLVVNFHDLFLRVFEIKGNYYPERRKRRGKTVYVFRSYSKAVFNEISSLEFPVGLKKYKLRIPQIIWDSSRKEKLLFLKGVIITDGSIRRQGNVLFHLATKKFIEDLSDLIYELFGLRKSIKEYIQRERFYSYQLLLNKKEAQEVLNC